MFFQAPQANGCKTVFELQQRSSVSPGPRSSGANSSGYGTANSRRSNSASVAPTAPAALSAGAGAEQKKFNVRSQQQISDNPEW